MPVLESCSETNLILKDRKILLVDDDRLNLRILAGILKPEGVNVAATLSGESALEEYARFQPDLVLLDVLMPGIDGFETCRRLKQIYGDVCAPVIFITAKHESEDIVEGLEAGGVDYLSKPFRPKEALARIRIHLQNKLLLAQQSKLVEQLSSANAAKNRFLGMAAHDLRNPLASIRALTEFLSDGTVGQLSHDQLDLVGSIHEASESMLTLVNELLDLAVIESGEHRLDLHPTSLGDLIISSVNQSNLLSAKKNTVIRFAHEVTAAKVLLDADKIKQVVDNLLSNAVKFSPPGSTIQVDLLLSAEQATVSVRDQGPGIPPGEHDRLFQDFGRTSVKPTAGEKSIGLGLAICKKLIEAHRGTICADNEPDGGCTFKFILPVVA
jgi:two-component system sensor histidine kinase/response regulator